MDAVTYRLSHLYLSRYRALRVLKDIVAYDSELSERPTPQLERTPQWFAAMYLRRLGHLEQDSPAVHLSSDSDYDSDSEADAPEEHKVRPVILRPLQHHTRAEILSLLAKHANWLIKDQNRVLHKGKRCFDVDVWQNWYRSVRRAKLHTHDADALLAFFAKYVQDDDDADDEEDENLMDVDEDVAGPSRASTVTGKRKADQVCLPSCLISSFIERIHPPALA